MQVPSGGYRWWYIDAISDDGRSAIVLIAFVGSVFSPYYAWSGRERPENHCALNVALYAPSGGRWAMTERRARDISRGARFFSVGRSRIERTAEGLDIAIDEVGAPLPRRVKGRVRVRLPWVNETRFDLDGEARHAWRPLCAAARVEATFDAPRTRWSGRGYVDTNSGIEPLEERIRYWDWSRAERPGGGAAIRYVADVEGGPRRVLSLAFDAGGALRETEAQADVALGPTPIWRIRRRTGAGPGGAPSLARTLEDTPFYSRSILRTADGRAVHESFDGARLRSSVVKAMLTVRMPRRSL